MNKTKTTNLPSITIVFSLMIAMIVSSFLLTACDESFENSTSIKTNAANTTANNMQYTNITVKAKQPVYINWTIDENAKDGASAYNLMIVDNDKNALTQDNKLTSVTIYDGNKKSLGTATTQTEGQYNLSAVLGDNKIAAGSYYAILEFATAGTYNVCIALIA